jgi:hypothetical protein
MGSCCRYHVAIYILTVCCGCSSRLLQDCNMFNGPFTLGRMPFRMFSEYESSGIFETVRISRRMCLLPKMSSMYHRMLSVCFPNVFNMISEWFPNTPNGFRIYRILPEYGPFAPRTPTFIFGKHSSYSKYIRGVRKAYRTQHLIPNAPRSRRMLSERFPYTPYVPIMLPEYFPNTHAGHIRKVDGNYFEHAQHIFGATECRSV